VVIAIIALLAGLLCLAQLAGAETRRLSRADLLDKIRGGWTGHPKYNVRLADQVFTTSFWALSAGEKPRIS
jgi:hypothetical protein